MRSNSVTPKQRNQFLKGNSKKQLQIKLPTQETQSTNNILLDLNANKNIETNQKIDNFTNDLLNTNPRKTHLVINNNPYSVPKNNQELFLVYKLNKANEVQPPKIENKDLKNYMKLKNKVTPTEKNDDFNYKKSKYKDKNREAQIVKEIKSLRLRDKRMMKERFVNDLDENNDKILGRIKNTGNANDNETMLNDSKSNVLINNTFSNGSSSITNTHTNMIREDIRKIKNNKDTDNKDYVGITTSSNNIITKKNSSFQFPRYNSKDKENYNNAMPSINNINQKYITGNIKILDEKENNIADDLVNKSTMNNIQDKPQSIKNQNPYSKISNTNIYLTNIPQIKIIPTNYTKIDKISKNTTIILTNKELKNKNYSVNNNNFPNNKKHNHSYTHSKHFPKPETKLSPDFSNNLLSNENTKLAAIKRQEPYADDNLNHSLHKKIIILQDTRSKSVRNYINTTREIKLLQYQNKIKYELIEKIEHRNQNNIDSMNDIIKTIKETEKKIMIFVDKHASYCKSIIKQRKFHELNFEKLKEQQILLSNEIIKKEQQVSNIERLIKELCELKYFFIKIKFRIIKLPIIDDFKNYSKLKSSDIEFIFKMVFSNTHSNHYNNTNKTDEGDSYKIENSNSNIIKRMENIITNAISESKKSIKYASVRNINASSIKNINSLVKGSSMNINSNTNNNSNVVNLENYKKDKIIVDIINEYNERKNREEYIKENLTKLFQICKYLDTRVSENYYLNHYGDKRNINVVSEFTPHDSNSKLMFNSTSKKNKTRNNENRSPVRESNSKFKEDAENNNSISPIRNNNLENLNKSSFKYTANNKSNITVNKLSTLSNNTISNSNSNSNNNNFININSKLSSVSVISKSINKHNYKTATDVKLNHYSNNNVNNIINSNTLNKTYNYNNNLNHRKGSDLNNSINNKNLNFVENENTDNNFSNNSIYSNYNNTQPIAVFKDYKELMSELKVVEEECQELMKIRNNNSKNIEDLRNLNLKIKSEQKYYDDILDKELQDKVENVKQLKLKNTVLKDYYNSLYKNLSYEDDSANVFSQINKKKKNESSVNYIKNDSMTAFKNSILNKSFLFDFGSNNSLNCNGNSNKDSHYNSSISLENNYVYVYQMNLFMKEDFNFNNKRKSHTNNADNPNTDNSNEKMRYLINSKIFTIYNLTKNNIFVNLPIEESNLNSTISKLQMDKDRNSINNIIHNRELMCSFLAIIEKNLNYLQDWVDVVKTSNLEKQYLNLIDKIEKVKKRENTISQLRLRDERVIALKRKIEDKINQPDRLVNKRTYKKIPYDKYMLKEIKCEEDINNDDKTFEDLISYK